MGTSNMLMSNGRGEKKGDARFGAGLEGSFSSFGETSLVVLTLGCQVGKWRGDCRVSLWGDDSRSYNAPGLIPTFLR